ncbi:MAG: Arc family DNA-binding protein [Clostridia bacterium]|nr:Arc family DNA-binding protein [Clostridia bacterium]
MAVKSLSIRIDEEMLDKLHCVADYEGRSANSQILILIRDCIEQFEERHGKIEITKRKPKKDSE